MADRALISALARLLPKAQRLMAAATPRADPAISSFSGLHIRFGTKDRAQAGVRPCTGQRGGQNLAASGRDIRSRTYMTRGKDTDEPQFHRHRRW
jgi:hypothetical protein